jgi:hypothetical protein
MKFSVLAAALGLGLLVSGSASATEYATGAPSPTATTRLDKAALQARAQECAKEADVRGLKGKERRRFKEKCRKGLK